MACSNPLGRILNRFTKDIDNVDLLLPQAFSFFLVSGGLVLTAVVIVAAVQPWILVPIVPLGASPSHFARSVHLLRLSGSNSV
jgi:hypothetical protein